MTIRIVKSASNDFSLSNCLDRSIYATRTYRMAITNDLTKEAYSWIPTPTINSNRFDFTLIEGTDLTFTNDGFHTYELYEVFSGSENLLCTGKLKVVDTRTAPTTPTAINNQTYVVANAGQ